MSDKFTIKAKFNLIDKNINFSNFNHKYIKIFKAILKNISIDNNYELPVRLNEDIKYLENGEVDTSDWKIYRNKIYKMEIKYPPFLTMHADYKDDRFSMGSPKINQIRIDGNWDIQFGGTFPGFRKLSLEEKRGQFKHKKDQSVVFEEIEIENGFIYYFIGRGKPGYMAGSNIFSKNYILAGGLQIYSNDPSLSEYDPKYINIFKTMLKTIKFDE